MQKYVLGIDVGTGGTRALIMDETGEFSRQPRKNMSPLPRPR